MQVVIAAGLVLIAFGDRNGRRVLQKHVGAHQCHDSGWPHHWHDHPEGNVEVAGNDVDVIPLYDASESSPPLLAVFFERALAFAVM